MTIATRPPRHSFRFRGRNFLALVLRPEKPLADWLGELDKWLERSPGFFSGKPLILDVSGLGFAKSDIAEVIAELRKRAIRILGIEGADADVVDESLPPLLTGGRTSGSVEAIDAISRRPPAEATKPTEATKPAEASKPAVVSKRADAANRAEPIKPSESGKPADAEPAAGGEPEKSATADASTAEASAAAASQVPSLLMETPVRSGQTVMNPDGDVIILGSVASGAEVIAAGSIHVYGTLRGRALAGAYGNESARVFCRRFEAELIAVGGYYKVTEDTESGLRSKPVQAWLSGNELMVASLDQADKEMGTWRKS